jgi:hypothetical protein
LASHWCAAYKFTFLRDPLERLCDRFDPIKGLAALLGQQPKDLVRPNRSRDNLNVKE